MDWARILALVTGMVDQELLARIEYLAAENRILKAQLKGRSKPDVSAVNPVSMPGSRTPSRSITSTPGPRTSDLGLK